MPLSRLENFLKNAEGNILYVSPSDFDATDSFENQGNSLTRPFKTIQRALIEAARFSYQNGRNNDKIDRTTILVYPGTHYIDNRPGYSIASSGNNAVYKKRTGSTTWTTVTLDEFGVNTNYDILDTNNDLYKFNSVNGGVILPRGTSIIGYDLRKTKIRPLYVPNPEDTAVENSSIFNVTGTCYFSIFTFLDADTTKTVFRDYTDNRFVPNFSHHKLASFAYADGVNKVVLGGTEQTDLTDLDMYYYKVARAYGDLTGRNVIDYPNNNDFEPSTDEYRIVGSLQANPFGISSIYGGDGIITPKNVITVTTKDFLTGDDKPHGLFVDSPVLISGITADSTAFNGSFTVKEVVGLTTFTYTSTAEPVNAIPSPNDYESGIVTIEADTVSSASPYVFNCSIRSVYGLCGMWADGAKADGFKSMVVAQFTGVSLQKDDNAFLIYEDGTYQSNATLDVNSTQRPLHTNGNAIYKPDYENTHIRVSNNGFVQCVSIFAIGFAKHFLTESGGDMSITNSNSNFGAISLESTGFRDESFDRDDVGYITHIIPPKEIDNIESEVTWLSLDVPKTISVGNTSNLYIYNYKSFDIKPTHQIDGYRIGAKTNEKLNLTIVVGTSQTTYSTPILMPVPSGTGVSSKKIYTVSKTGIQNNITNNIFTLSSNHQLYNGEKVRIFSDTSQVPDGIIIDTVYYVITTGLASNEIKLAYTLSDAIANQSIIGINNNGGTLTIVSSVGDKLPGDFGHPIQYDTSQGQWYITGTSSISTNQIYDSIVGFGTGILGDETASTFVTRKVDSRSIEDRIYKVRYVIPKEFTNARPPTAGFILQETKTVGVSTISFDNTPISNSTPPAYLRNEKIISNASVGAVSNGSQVVTITTELPHGFIIGDTVKVQKIRSANNTLGTGLTSTYNGSYTVLSVPSTKQFTYKISGVKINPGTFSNLINERDTRQERDQLPVVSREKYLGNYFIYRVNQIKNHVPGIEGQDGIYNLIVLASNVSPPSTVGYGISQKAFNQDVRNLYPQVDRDNFDSDPGEAISFSDIQTIGKVVTGDKKKSITKETINSFIKNTSIGFGITGISTSGIAGTTVTIHTNIEHNLNSLKRVEISVAGSGYGNTTIYASSLTGGSGANGSVRANLSSGTVGSVSIVDPGCAYVVGNTLTVSGAPGIGFSVPSTLSVTEINNNVGDGIELSGFNQNNLNGVYKILSVPSSKSFTIYNPTGVTNYTQNTNGRLPVAVLASKGVGISSFRFDSVSTGIVTVTTSAAHGLLPGNKFTIVGSGHTIYDNSFFVKEYVGLNTFTFYVGILTQTKASTTGTLLKHGISANALNLTRGEENLASRASYIYAGITTTITTPLTTSSSTIVLSSAAGFNRGDYVLINSEILRLASAPTVNTFTVLRSRFSTYKTTAESGSQVKKIKVLPMEVRRPSFMRASGHTFEYLGYGPGNYSTGMPQKQTRTLSEDDILTSQAREQSGGTVVYSGMNDIGEFYSGTKKLSSITGEEKVIEAPIITFTGDDAEGENQNRLSGIFDDVLIKERITVEGGDNGNQSSQFYGPVNFTKKVTNTSEDGINTKNLFIKGTASQGKLITVGISTPTSLTIPSPSSGDVSLKANPTDRSIGQVYVDNKWKKFGLISDSADILDIKVDRLGIGDPSVFDNFSGVGDSELYVAGDIKLQNLIVTGSSVFTSNVILSDVNFDIINVRKTIRFSGIAGTSYAMYVDDPNIANSNTALKTRLYDLQVANDAYVSGNLGIGTTTPTKKLDVIGNSNISGNLGIGKTLDLYNTISSNPTAIFARGADNSFQLTSQNGSSLNASGQEVSRFGINYSGTGWNTFLQFIRGGGAIDGSLAIYTNNTESVRFTSSNNVGIGITNPTNKLVVSGTIGIDGSSSTAGRTQLSSSAGGFVLNHNDNSPIIIQTQSVERLRIGAAGTITASGTNSGRATGGTFLRITNAGNGDAVISWDNTFNNANQRWYAGIDVNDSYAWKLARPDFGYFGNELFSRDLGGGNLPETKLKIDTSGNATFLGNLTSIGGSLTLSDKFTVAGATGNTTIAGTLNVTGNLALNTDKFTVNSSTGAITGSSILVSGDGAVVNQHNGSGTLWYGRILSKNSTTNVSSFLGNFNGKAGVFAHNNALTDWADLWINTLGSSGNGVVHLPPDTRIHANNSDTYYTNWHSGNDGSGSGLDADLLDGFNSDRFLRSLGFPGYGNWNDFGNNQQTVYEVYQENFNLGTNTGSTNFPGNVSYRYGTLVNFGANASARAQIYISHAGNDLIFRGGWGTTGWNSWNRVWTDVNDGAGSGLDADLLDGLDSSSFLRSNANTSASGVVDFTGGSSSTPAIRIRSGGSSWAEGLAIHPSSNNGYALAFFRTRSSFDDSTNTWALGNLGESSINNFGLIRNGLTGSLGIRIDSVFDVTQSGTFRFGFTPTVGPHTIWHSGNDGSGSGLDADLFDGLNSSSFVRTDARTAITVNGRGTSYTQSNLELYTTDNTPPGISFHRGGVSAVNLYENNGYLYQDRWQGGGGLIWTSGNDGAGSGLDADTIDGIDSSRIVYGSNANKTTGTGNLNLALSSGFYDSFEGTGSPSSTTWYHIIHSRHSNDNNNFAMQIAGNFYNSSLLYYRIINDNNPTGWHQIWHSGNDGAGTGLDADLLDGLQSSTANNGSTIVARDSSGNFSANTITATLSGNASSANYATSAGSANSASTATNLSTNRTNWASNGTISAVVGQLSWKNYGNNHTIFDASASTSPDGTTVNNTNAQVPWGAPYPTLMGWNGSNTFGVRVDSARVADSALSVSGTIPIGGIIMWSGNYVPTGWSLCNGQDGTPDLRNRFVVGAFNVDYATTPKQGPLINPVGGGITRNYAPGDTGGESAHQLTLNEMPSHKHTTNLDGRRVFVVEGPIIVPYGGAGGYPGQYFSMDTAGGDGNGNTNFHENRPPYYALAYIMRVS